MKRVKTIKGLIKAISYANNTPVKLDKLLKVKDLIEFLKSLDAETFVYFGTSLNGRQSFEDGLIFELGEIFTRDLDELKIITERTKAGV